MKRTLLMLTIMISAATMAQDIKLPAPNQSEKSMSVVEALRTRHSVRDFSTKELTQQQISNLCWATCGLSRDKDHRTAPTAMNRKEIRLFVVTKEAAYEYDAVNNTLVKKASGDHRSVVAGTKQFKQDFVMQAPVSLVMVVDYELFGSMDEHAKVMCNVDAGIVCENINLYCQAVGLATVPRATMDSEGLRKILNLSEKQLPVLNNPVGYAK